LVIKIRDSYMMMEAIQRRLAKAEAVAASLVEEA
jgi:hypothetical protein